MSNPNNVAGGHKANLNNPRTSEESKEHSRQVMDEMESSGALDTNRENDMKNIGSVLGGHKANLKNPNTSEEAKQHSRQALEENDVEI